MAPEIILGRPYAGPKVDLFAAGIILFIMVSKIAPFASADPKEMHYKVLAGGRPDLFWSMHSEAQDGQDIFSAEFKDLFQSMMMMNPARRPSIDQILAHPFMHGPEATCAEILLEFTKRKQVLDAEAKRERDRKRVRREEIRQAVRRSIKSDDEEREGERDAWHSLTIESYGPCFLQAFT